MSKKKIRGVICAVLGGICWGFSGCCGQYLFSYKDIDAGWLTSIRLLSSGIILLIISLIFQRKNLFGAVRDKKDMTRILAFGIFGLMMTQLSYLTAIEYTNAATATVIQYVGPVLVMCTVCIYKRTLPKIYELAAVILAVIGTFLIATHGNIHSLAISAKGLIWCILAALTLVAYTLIPGYVTEKRSSFVVSGYGMTAGGIILSFVYQIWKFPALDFEAMLAILGIIVFGTVFAFTLYLKAISDIGPVKASIIASIEPVSSAVISALWLKTEFAAIDIVGFIMIISTVFLLAFKDIKNGNNKDGD